MAAVRSLNQLSEAYCGRVTFFAIYVAEAHSADEWPIGQTFSSVDQPTTQKRRCEVASDFVKKTGLSMPILCDSMQNEFCKVWGGWPFRFYGIEDGVLRLKPQPNQENNYNFDLVELKEWLVA